MFKGFYTTTSSMLTENRRLGVISNNLSNIATPGYKADRFPTTNFGTAVAAVTSNNTTGSMMELGDTSMIVLPAEADTNFERGNIEDTGSVLDFAITKDGFFTVQGEDGLVYTKNGSFSLDQGGFLYLQGTGRVMGVDGPIQLDSIDSTVDPQGGIIGEDGEDIAQLRIVDFANYDNFAKVGEGVFATNDPIVELETIDVRWKAAEASNVDPSRELTTMMETQRALQGAAQLLKIYDQLTAKAATEIGRI